VYHNISLIYTYRNVSEKKCRGNQNIKFVFNNFFFPENSAVYEIMAETDSLQMTLLCCIKKNMRFAFRVTDATNTHSGYVTLFAFPQQQWLREGASVLYYTYTARVI